MSYHSAQLGRGRYQQELPRRYNSVGRQCTSGPNPRGIYSAHAGNHSYSSEYMSNDGMNSSHTKNYYSTARYDLAKPVSQSAEENSPYVVPQSNEEIMNSLIYCSVNPSDYELSDYETHHHRYEQDSEFYEKQLESQLIEVASHKGLLVSFEICKYSKNFNVTVRAGSYLTQSTHKRKRAAKLSASKELLNILVKLPDCNIPSPPYSIDSSPSNLNVSTPPHSKPIHQLKELVLQEKWSKPVYSVSCCDTVPIKYYLCSVQVGICSAIGVGVTRKDSKEMAAANLLSAIKAHDINKFTCISEVKYNNDSVTDTANSDDTYSEPYHKPNAEVTVPHCDSDITAADETFAPFDESSYTSNRSSYTSNRSSSSFQFEQATISQRQLQEHRLQLLNQDIVSSDDFKPFGNKQDREQCKVIVKGRGRGLSKLHTHGNPVGHQLTNVDGVGLSQERDTLMQATPKVIETTPTEESVPEIIPIENVPSAPPINDEATPTVDPVITDETVIEVTMETKETTPTCNEISSIDEIANDIPVDSEYSHSLSAARSTDNISLIGIHSLEVEPCLDTELVADTKVCQDDQNDDQVSLTCTGVICLPSEGSVQ